MVYGHQAETRGKKKRVIPFPLVETLWCRPSCGMGMLWGLECLIGLSVTVKFVNTVFESNLGALFGLICVLLTLALVFMLSS